MTKLNRKLFTCFIFLLLAFLVCITGISCNRKVSSKINTVTIIKDSISYKETLKFDTITIPADTLITTHTIECDSLTNKPKPIYIQQSGKRSSNAIQIDNKGVLTSTVNCDELQKIIASKDREIRLYKALEYTKEDHQTYLSWYIPKFYKICFGISLLIITITIIKFLYKWRKLINPML